MLSSREFRRNRLKPPEPRRREIRRILTGRRVLLFAAILVAAVLVSRLLPKSEQGLPSTASPVQVAAVVDGDTFRMPDGQLVRILGINTPETHSPNLEHPEPLGEAADARLRLLIEGKEVGLEADQTDKDQYGRLLRHVWVGPELVAELLAREGLGHALTIPPNQKYSERIQAAEAEAKRSGRGVWGLPHATSIPAFAPGGPGEASASASASGAAAPSDPGAPFDSGASAGPSTPSSSVAGTTAGTNVTTNPSSGNGTASDLAKPCGARVAGAIPPESAADFIDTYQAVEFQVVRSRDTGKITYLNSHDPFEGHFYVAVFPDQYDDFARPPAELFRGKCIVVQGTIERFRGTPQIVLRGADDVRVVGR